MCGQLLLQATYVFLEHSFDIVFKLSEIKVQNISDQCTCKFEKQQLANTYIYSASNPWRLFNEFIQLKELNNDIKTQYSWKTYKNNESKGK